MTREVGEEGGHQKGLVFMNAEYPMIRFLERNGFDMSYTTDVDMARNNANNINLLRIIKFFFLSVMMNIGQKRNETVEAARAAGKHLAFFSGNEVLLENQMGK